MAKSFSVTINDRSTLRALMGQVWEMVKKGLESGPVVVTLSRLSKNAEQRKKYHAMINDFVKQITFNGNKRYSMKVWKAKLVEQFAVEKEQMGEPLRHTIETTMSLDGKRVISVRPSTEEFLKAEAGEFIEFLYMTGSEMEIKWSEPALKVYAEYREMNNG